MKIRASPIITAAYKNLSLDNISFKEEKIDHIFNVGHSSSMIHILCGDFNIAISRPNNNIANLLPELDVYDFKLLSKMKEYTRETKQTKSTIHLVFSNTNLQTKVLKTAITDHNTIKIELWESTD